MAFFWPRLRYQYTLMLKNYLRIALRYMSRNKAYSFINIVGLSIGMAVFILISLWVHDELSFNLSIPNYDRIAMITRQFNYNSISYFPPRYALCDERRTVKKVPWPTLGQSSYLPASAITCWYMTIKTT